MILKLQTLSLKITSIIRNLGEDVNQGILSTPVRAAAMQYLTHGYGLDPLEILKSALFTEDHRQMIVVKY
jgi:GTP cyclohydrolase I